MTTTVPVRDEPDAGTYDVLRARLARHGRDLGRRAEDLDARRAREFGTTAMRLLGTEPVRTARPCVPRDVVGVGGVMLFGFNGLSTGTGVEDVFAAYGFHRDGDAFHLTPADPPWLRDDRLRHDLAELYRYHRQTRLLQLGRRTDRLLAAFQIGPRPTDVRVLRWEVAADGTVSYLDDRGEREYAFPARYDFEWTPVTREQHVVVDRRPVASIDGDLYVSTTGGELRVTVVSDDGAAAAYAEPVDEPLQSLADAAVAYARVGALILLRVRPYKETADRYFVVNTHTRDVSRLDGIGQACQRLPDDRGIVFPGGYCLGSGGTRTVDVDVRHMEFERVIRPAGAADVLYVFHARAAGRSLLVPYNLVRDEVGAPIEGHGYSLFDDGTMVVLRADTEDAVRVHPLQVWHTPYREEVAVAVGGGPLARIGDAELVRAIADCLSLARTARDVPATTAAIEALTAAGARLLDRHHWLGDADVGDLRSPVSAVREAAAQLLAEHDRVLARAAAARRVEAETADLVAALVRRTGAQEPATTAEWVAHLAELRVAQGRLAARRDVPYVDLARLDELAARLAGATADAGRRAVAFLAGPEAFTPYHAQLDRLDAAIRDLDATGAAATDAAALAAQIAGEVDGLRAVTEVVNGLDAGTDNEPRARILAAVGTVLAGLNRARATLDGRVRDLRARDGRAVFIAETALLRQSVTAALALADTPQRCDTELAALLLRLEDLETRTDDDEQRAALAAQRAETRDAFAGRKQALLDEQARRVQRLTGSAERILAAIGHRAAELASLDEVTAYFAADPLVGRLRAVVAELRRVGDPVRAADAEARLLTARQDAGRTVRDRADLYGDGGATVRLGAHRFAVNTEPVDLVLVPDSDNDGDGLALAVTGTDYRRPVRDEAFALTRRFWDRPVASESPTLYRGEYLAARLVREHGAALADLAAADLAALVAAAASARYDEGYVAGVHDHDAVAIATTLLGVHTTAGLLRYPPDVRAAAQVFWARGGPDPRWAHRAAALVRARAGVGAAAGLRELTGDLRAAAHEFLGAAGLPDGGPLVGEYLAEELAAGPAGFAVSRPARELVRRFDEAHGDVLRADLRGLTGDTIDDAAARYQVAAAWLSGFAGTHEADFVPEAVALAAFDLPRYDVAAELTSTVDGLLGTHPRITDGRLEVRLDDVLARADAHAREEVPAYRAYRAARARLLAGERDSLRVDEHVARVPGSFVRNRLIDEVYLPLIGDNLAQQLGTATASRATDRSGLLVLVSPPGYGKTTLVEYVASRLGLLLVRVNGPALGTGVTSLDPAQAPDAAARQEVEKINFALSLGTNVMLYLDDIQHTSPELLQRFVPLCDASRRIEGVRDGRAVTYDLRGKRFAVCLAGNPYTESGGRFRLPDMLANRADVWNLGEVLAGRDDLFELSYVENALTANPVLATIQDRDPADVPMLVRLAEGDTTVQLSGRYPADDLARVRQVLTHLLRARAVVLAVNGAYIASAAQDDAARTEPPFLLQGSYRDMNSIARRIQPVMDAAELDALIDDHYLGEAKALGSAAEANLLKLAGLRGRQTPEQAERWTHVTAAYRRRQALGGGTDDPVGRAVGAITLLTDRLEAAILRAADASRTARHE